MAHSIVDDPAGDPHWSALVDRHPAASVFHSPGWLRALQQTYGYEPLVVSSSAGNGLVACRVNSWPSHRLVSLPFSDHCNPLLDQPDDLAALLPSLMEEARKSRATAVELRPAAVAGRTFDTAAGACGLRPAGAYTLHRLDLRAAGDESFRRFHHSMRRAVRRAGREGITYEAGVSERLLGSFYRLLRMARRRHRLVPQPLAWFRNLLAHLRGSVSIHVASKNAEPIASILTLSFKKTIYYKYGGSDATHHRSGGMPFLFWRVIQDATARGFEELDLGRSDVDQPGLIAFKAHLGATQSALRYYRYPSQGGSAHRGWMSQLARGTIAYLPDGALDLAGKLIYRRLG